MKRKIAILTSGDYLYAGRVCLNLLDNNFDVHLIDVKKSVKKFESKQFKIFFLFGLFGTLNALVSFLRVKRQLVVKYNLVVKVQKKELYKHLQSSKYDLIVMINYPYRIDVGKTGTIINMHPGKLPDFRGLMPICHTFVNSMKNNTESVVYHMSMHIINSEFDRGVLLADKGIELNRRVSLCKVYSSVYSLSESLIYDYFSRSSTTDKTEITAGRYYRSFTWPQVLTMKIDLLKSSKFKKFLINGGVIGLISWLLQLLVYHTVNITYPESEHAMVTSIYSAFVIAMIINFFSQSYLVFNRSGSFIIFLLASFTMISLVSFVAQYCEQYLVEHEMLFFVNFAYPVSALAVSPLSFFIKKTLVFNAKPWV